MKKTLILVFCLLTLVVSCKNDTKSDTSATPEQSDLQTLKGDFVYYADAAVLQTSSEIYGVVINTKMHELNKQASAFKTEPTDMIPVEVRGIIIPKPENEEGWPLRIDIKEIVNVSKPKAENNNVIKLGKE